MYCTLIAWRRLEPIIRDWAELSIEAKGLPAPINSFPRDQYCVFPGRDLVFTYLKTIIVIAKYDCGNIGSRGLQPLAHLESQSAFPVAGSLEHFHENWAYVMQDQWILDATHGYRI